MKNVLCIFSELLLADGMSHDLYILGMFPSITVPSVHLFLPPVGIYSEKHRYISVTEQAHNKHNHHVLHLTDL